MNPSSTNHQFELATAFVTQTSRHLFLTGKAGTGKTTFLKNVINNAKKKTVIVAPTGVAAVNAGGVTVHSFFQLPLGYFLPVRRKGFSLTGGIGLDLDTLLAKLRMNAEKKKLMRELELLVVDEVSMLRADILDAMDGILRHVRKDYSRPFGGVQVLYIGDLYQLPPVVKEDEWHYLREYYQTMFFFDAQVIRQVKPLTIELETVYRQKDDKFIDLLNSIRNNVASEEELRLLNKYYDPSFYPDPEEGYIMLTSHNYKADKINNDALRRLSGEPYSFEGTVHGDFNEHALPVEKSMTLKVGAQVMFIRNDKGEQRRYYNGKIGIVSKIAKEQIYVRFPGSQEELQVEKEVWRNIRYQYNEQKDQVEEDELGSYHQFPLRLAWAVTIHKSQGLTFEKAIIDAGESFAAGQVYVALSRLTRLGGLVLASEITPAAISTDPRIGSFIGSPAPVSELQHELIKAQKEYIASLVFDCFSFSELLNSFRENHQLYRQRKLPHQAEAVQWSDGQIRALSAFEGHSQKFRSQLSAILSASEMDNQLLRERIGKATSYFERELAELIAACKLHIESGKTKTKVRKYQSQVGTLYTELVRKREKIMAVPELINGMIEGKNPGKLLDSFQNNTRTTVEVPETEDKKAKKEDTRSISLKMLRKGMNIDEIAMERALVRSTIEVHLASFIVSGEVTLSELVEPEKEQAIRKVIAETQDPHAGTVKARLGDEYTYGEIRAVFKQLEREQLM